LRGKGNGRFASFTSLGFLELGQTRYQECEGVSGPACSQTLPNRLRFCLFNFHCIILRCLQNLQHIRVSKMVYML
jgi:hypothetical protein